MTNLRKKMCYHFLMLSMAMKAQVHQCGHRTWATPEPTETQQTSNEPLEASFLKEPSDTDWDSASVPPLLPYTPSHQDYILPDCSFYLWDSSLRII